MAKTRVSQLAKEYGSASTDLLTKIRTLGIDVTTAASGLTEEDVLRVKHEIFAEPKQVEEKKIGSFVVRRRRRKADEPETVSEDGMTAADRLAVPTTTPGLPGEAVDEGDGAPTQLEPGALSTVDEIRVPSREEQVSAVSMPPVAEAKVSPAESMSPKQVAPALRAIESVTPSSDAPKTLVLDDAGDDDRGRGRRRRIVREDRLERRFDGGRKRRVVNKKVAKKTELTTPKASKRIVRMTDMITVGELAKQLSVKAGEIIRKLMEMGLMVTINQAIDYDTAVIIATGYEFEVQNVGFSEEALIAPVEEDKPEDLVHRPPVVTVMGHVDHGKTSLLDAIRKTEVTAGEAGGITQHIGAYEVHVGDHRITFIDTPGHEAFTAMRARGAQVTDIVVLVVAADDGVMPQTREAIDHARAADVPIVVAINKIDKPGSDLNRLKTALAELNLTPEEWGGETLCVGVSAKVGTNIDKLLETILLQAEILELTANPDKRATGVVIESQLDRGRGPVATVLVKEGMLKVGDYVVAGPYYAKVKALMGDRGAQQSEAGPSVPVEIIGWSGVPDPGEAFNGVEDEKKARAIIAHRQQKLREQELAKSGKVSLDQLYQDIERGVIEELRVVVKADVLGSMEAVAEALTRLSTEKVKLKVIHKAVGGITENDVMLASASNALIIGFNVRPETKAQTMAEQEKVQIRSYRIIYDAVNEVKQAMKGLLAPKLEERYLGRVEVRQLFKISKIGTVAGCSVVDGKVLRSARVRIVRDASIVYDGKLSTLKRFKDDTREVAEGFECGLSVENFNDLKIGDLIEAYTVEEVEATL